MIPPSFAPPMTGKNIHSTTSTLPHQMQAMNLRSSPVENLSVVPSVNQPSHPVHVPFSPPLQSKIKNSSVTSTWLPNATYPNDNPSNSNLQNYQTVPPINSNPIISNSSSSQLNSYSQDLKTPQIKHTQMYSSQSPLRNGMSNGHSDLNLSREQVQSVNKPPPMFQQGLYQTLPQSPQNFSPQQYQQPSAVSNPSNAPNFPPAPPLQDSSSNPMFNPGNVQSLSSGNYQNITSQPNSAVFSSPQNFPPGSLQYSGMPSSPPNSGGMWPNQQFLGVTPPTPGGYPYAQQHQQMPVQQQPRRLELDQMPSVVDFREEDRKTRSGFYPTDTKGQVPPLATTNFTVQDRGLCSPRFIRSTVYCLPNQPDMLKQTGIPFALTVSPLATLNEGETTPPVCLFREQGPLRCKRCKAYICPFMTFMEGGRCFQCAFCKVLTEVPQDYFCFLDGIGERSDKFHRPELCLGSYEFIGTKEYCRNNEMPNPPAYIFMMEVSNATFRNGLVPLLCENMKSVLQSLKNDEKNDISKLRVGFVTYNSVLHFYNMKKNLTQPHIMVLSDVHNAFVPLLDGFLVTLSEAEALVDCLMEHIPRLFINEPATEVILGPVIQVGLEALKNANCSGKLLVFHSTIPNADAPGKLPHREGQKLLGTDKQKTVLSPQHEFYYRLAQDCVAAGCAVDLFLFPSAYVDIATVSPLCRHTGGQIYKYTYFQSHIDGDRFLEDLERNLTTPTAFDAVLRVRTSAGISPIFYYGNFYMSNTTDVELSAVDGHKAITIEMAYDDKLPENETVFIQAALLYTSITGERRIRVHNLAIPTSVGMPDVFRASDLDTILNYFAKQAVKQVLEIPPQQIKSNLVNRSVKILSCYRKHCATNSSSCQLILPDSLKLLPVYINCLLKSDAIAGGSEMSLDDRSFAMMAVNTMDGVNTALHFYPTLIPLHNVDPDSDATPKAIRCSIEKLNDNGAYLLENGIYMFLWIGQAISSEWLQNVFGVQSTNQVDKQRTSLPDLNNPLSKEIRCIIEDLQEGRQWYMRLRIMVQGDKLESVFRQFLVEDRGTDGSASYVDFLCHLHKEISKNL